MKISKTAQYAYIIFAVAFLFYLTYAATLYMDFLSVSFAFVFVTALMCSLILVSSIKDSRTVVEDNLANRDER